MNELCHADMSRTRITEAAFSLWLARAAPGTALQYHDGYLAMDVVTNSPHLSGSDRKSLVAIARLAWWASERGIVHLVQRRLGPGRFAYLAIMRVVSAGSTDRNCDGRSVE